MIAARQIFLGRGGGGGGWVNPYITDGLVAMWDGEWNAGCGVHDASATTWKNLADGGADTEVVGDISSMWYDDHIVTINSNYVKIPVSAMTSATIEIISANMPNGSAIKYWSLIGANNDEILGGYTESWGGYRVGTLSPRLYATAALSSMTDKVYWAITISATGTCIYAKPSSSDVIDAQTIDISNARYFYAAYSNTQSSRDRPVYVTRLYSRALAAAEIAANHAIDAERFNLT